MKRKFLRNLAPVLLAAALPGSARADEPAAAPEAKPAVVSEAIEIPAAAEAEEMNMPEVPKDVAAAPEDAEKTESGLASKVLTKGTGETMPAATDTVTVHYSGWTTDGKMFDSSVARGQPSTFPLNGVIKGWTEGLQLMVEGEKRRFWIPAELGYGENPGGGRPGGMLVFDVELVSIKTAPKPPDDTLKTEAGVAYKITKEGDDKGTPTEKDIATIQFTAATMEGDVMQDTRNMGAPPSIPLGAGGLPPALTENLMAMSAGEQRQIWIAEPNLPGGFVVVDLELISFKTAPPAPKVPEDVKAAPEDAVKTESGLASKVITEGKGDAKPAATDTVKVNYTGWTADGEMFDSSITRGEPAEFPLNGVIAGWTEGVQLMKVGETRRFWIPADLAYGENPGGGRPGGMLVFDIELLEIVE